MSKIDMKIDYFNFEDEEIEGEGTEGLTLQNVLEGTMEQWNYIAEWLLTNEIPKELLLHPNVDTNTIFGIFSHVDCFLEDQNGLKHRVIKALGFDKKYGLDITNSYCLCCKYSKDPYCNDCPIWGCVDKRSRCKEWTSYMNNPCFETAIKIAYMAEERLDELGL